MLRKVVLASVSLVLSLVVAGWAGAVVVWFYPHFMRPSVYHPRNLYYRLQGFPVNPYVPLNPDRTYALDYWDTAWPVLWEDEHRYQDFLDQAVRAFQKQYPNVTVNIRLARPGELEGNISQALNGRTPPDVYSGPFLPFLAANRRLVPVTPFLPLEERDLFAPPALAGVGEGGQVWAWPRWIEVYAWAGNARILASAGIDHNRVSREGWSRADFLAAARAIRGDSRTTWEKPYGLVLDHSRPESFHQLMLGAGSPSLLTPEGAPRRTAPAVREVAGFLNVLWKERVFPADADRMPEKILDLFWTGRTAVIGPVGPGFLRHLSERLGRIREGDLKGATPVDVTLLPVPGGPDAQPVVPLSVHALAVFRPRPAEDPARARLAVEFARFLITSAGPWLEAELATVPAYLPFHSAWREKLSLDPPLIDFLLRGSATGTPFPFLSPPAARTEHRLWAEVVAPALRTFWAGNLDPETLERRIAEGTDALLKGKAAAGD